MSRRPDLSFVLVSHDAGIGLFASVVSADRALDMAAAAGRKVERILLLHAAGPTTREWVSSRLPNAWRVVTAAEASCLGAARRLAFAKSRGRHVAFMDGGDLCSGNWLHAVLDAADGEGRPAVWHPELAITFGPDYFSAAGYGVRFHPDVRAGNYVYAWGLTENHFSSCFTVARSLAEAVPFPLEEPASGWTDSDWWWNCDIAGEGYDHLIVPETFHYQRMDGEGRLFARAPQPPHSRVGPTPLAWRARRGQGPKTAGPIRRDRTKRRSAGT